MFGGMAPLGERPWWPLVGSGLIGALIAVAVIVATTGGTGGVRSASATRPASTTTAPAPPPAEPRIAFIGDSWTEGIGATALEGYAEVTADRLGWASEVLGVGGSGYVAPGRGSTFEQRIDRAVAFDPDVVVVQGSINERATDLAVLAIAAGRTLAELRDKVDDDAQILVVGASYVPGEDVGVVAGINRTIGAAAARVGLPFVNPAVEDWNDPQDPSIWADSRHPNDLGVAQVADHLVPLLREMVAA
jgi:lysophospholipase L1-like esterase